MARDPPKWSAQRVLWPPGTTHFPKKGPPLFDLFPCLVSVLFFISFSTKNGAKILHFSFHFPSFFSVCCSSRFLSHFHHKICWNAFLRGHTESFFFMNYSVFYHMISMSPFLVSRQFAENFRLVIHYFSMQHLCKILHFTTILHPFFVFEFQHPFLYEKWSLWGAILAPRAPQGPPFLVIMACHRLMFCSFSPNAFGGPPLGAQRERKGPPRAQRLPQRVPNAKMSLS